VWTTVHTVIRCSAAERLQAYDVSLDVIRIESVRGSSNVLIEGHFWRLLGNLNTKMLSAIVWTSKRHFLTSHRVFWAIMREIPCTGYFSRRVRGKKIKIKREALYFTYFARRSLTADWHKFWVTCLVDVINCAKFYHNRLRGLDCVRVEIWPFPLDCGVAVNTAWTNVPA